MNITNYEIGTVSETIVPIEHSIKDGTYTRIAYAKAGTLIVGCEHKKGGTAILLSGSIRQIDGELKYDIEAPKIFNTEPGTQRIAYAISDTVYATVHSVNSITVEDAEKEIFVQVPQITRIRNDFNSLLLSMDLTEDLVKEDMDSEELFIEDNTRYYLGNSCIHGIGCFTSSDINIGECIATASIDNQRFTTARYINHSDNPNAKFIDYKDSTILIATKFIPKEYEILVNYRERKICQE